MNIQPKKNCQSTNASGLTKEGKLLVNGSKEIII
jgi:hypothetical protein